MIILELISSNGVDVLSVKCSYKNSKGVIILSVGVARNSVMSVLGIGTLLTINASKVLIIDYFLVKSRAFRKSQPFSA